MGKHRVIWIRISTVIIADQHRLMIARIENRATASITHIALIAVDRTVFTLIPRAVIASLGRLNVPSTSSSSLALLLLLLHLKSLPDEVLDFGPAVDWANMLN